MEELDQLSTAVDELGTLPLLDQARALRGLIDQARGVMEALSLQRGAVFAVLTAPGAAYYRRIPLLAEEIPCHRSAIDDALAAHRAATKAT